MILSSTFFLTIALYILLFIDWRQTITIAKNPDKFREYNPILGKHPSEERVDYYFLVVAILAVVGLLFLAHWNSTWVLPALFIATLMELVVVIHNSREGIVADMEDF